MHWLAMGTNRLGKATLAAAAIIAISFGAGSPAMAATAPHGSLTGSLPQPGLVVPNIPASGNFNIHNENAAGKCIGVDGGGLAGIWTCTSNPDQTWHWGGAITTGWYQLVNGNGRCLALTGGSTASGTAIKAGTCYGTANTDQYWALISSPVAGAPYIVNYKGRFSSTATGWVVCVKGGSTANGAKLAIGPSQGHSDEYWY